MENKAHSILKNLININNNNDNNNKIINIQPIENRENYEIIISRKKSSLNKKTLKFNVNTINNSDYFIATVNDISIHKVPKIPVKKYSSKNNYQREFIVLIY